MPNARRIGRPALICPTSSNDLNPLLKGEGPAASQTILHRPLERALGHVVLLEALPGTTEAVRALMDETSVGSLATSRWRENDREVTRYLIGGKPRTRSKVEV